MPSSRSGRTVLAAVVAVATLAAGAACSAGPGGAPEPSGRTARDEGGQEAVGVQRLIRVHGGALDVSSRWESGDVRLVLTSPSGRVVDRGTQADDVTHELGPTYESLHVLAPEPGTWTASLHGTRVGPVGEDARLVVHQGDVAAGPQARISQVLAGRTVRVDARDSAAAGGRVVGYLWEFGDGATSRDELASHTYTAPGTYRVSLAVQDERGRWGVATAPTVLEVE